MPDNIKEAMTNAHLEMGLKATIERKKRELIVSLNGHIASFVSHLAEIETHAATDAETPLPVVNSATAAIEVTAQNAKAQIKVASEASRSAQKYYKMFVLEHNITWRATKPNTQMNALIFVTFAMIEGIITAQFFLNGGYVAGVLEALSLGLMISSINVVLAGLLGGGFFGKYWNFGLSIREDNPTVRQKRLAGRICSVLTVFAIIFVLLVSGIVRATGEPEHLTYTITSISTAASDFHSILLWVLGAAFAILSWRKGLSAFSSAYPGLSEASQAISESDALVKEQHEDALAEIDDICDDAREAIEDMSEDAADARQTLLDDLQHIQQHREDILAEISEAEGDFEVFQAEQTSIYRTLSDDDEVPQPVSFDSAVWHSKLQIPDIDTASHGRGLAEEISTARARLSEARQVAVQIINDAFLETLD